MSDSEDGNSSSKFFSSSVNCSSRTHHEPPLGWVLEDLLPAGARKFAPDYGDVREIQPPCMDDAQSTCTGYQGGCLICCIVGSCRVDRSAVPWRRYV